MNSTVELTGNHTSLKNQSPFGLDVLLISTSLMFINGVDQSEVNRKLVERQRPKYYGGSIPSTNNVSLLDLNHGINYGTTIDFCFPTFTFASATWDNSYDEGSDDNDFAVIPKFNKEFKIRVASLRIDRSLPKIFVE